MTEPLDFSSVGRRTAAPPPAGKPKRAPSAFTKPKAKTTALVLGVVALVVVAAVLFIGRGGANTPANDAVRVGRFCQLAGDLDRLAPYAAPGSASGAALDRVLRQQAGVIAELKATAPAAIRADVVATVTALQQAAKGNAAAVRSPSFTTRRQRISTFLGTTCSYVSGNGDG